MSGPTISIHRDLPLYTSGPIVAIREVDGDDVSGPTMAICSGAVPFSESSTGDPHDDVQRRRGGGERGDDVSGPTGLVHRSESSMVAPHSDVSEGEGRGWGKGG